MTMKKVFAPLLIALFVMIGLSAKAQTSLYTHPNFDNIARDHQIIAVLPFEATVSLRPKDMERMSAEDIAKMEESEGKSIQSAMYSWFLKRKKRGKLLVDVQTIAETNALLNKAGITQDNLSEFTPKEIAGLLGVDAVIMGTYETNKPMSEGAATALGLVFGVWGPTNQATVNLFIYNGVDGEVLTNYLKQVSGSMGSSPDDLINVLMRKASRRIAYTK